VRTPLRTARAAVLATLVVAAVLTGASAIAGAAVTSTATPSSNRVVESSDWATASFSDPFDFSNAEDLPPSSTAGLIDPTIGGGVMSFSATSGGYLQPIRTLGSISHGRDSDQFPIIAATNTRLSLRMYSGAASAQSGGITWFTCWGQVPSCASARSFVVQPGWNTYDLDMTQAPDLMNNTNGWSGAITGLRITPTGSTATAFPVKIDWLRIYQPVSPVTVTVAGSNGNEVWWDADTDPNNNDTTSASGGSAGRLATNVNAGGTVSFNPGAFPPGTYRFFTRVAGQNGPYSTALTIAPRPAPQFLSPTLETGEDYATTVRGDAWDFSQSTDVYGVGNFIPSFGGGVMTGTGAGNAGDPFFYLPTAGDVDATRWHKLTFRISYDGGFSLADAPGGGMNMRLIWGVDNGNGGISWHDGQDVVVTPGWQTISIDLKSSPPSYVEDDTSTNPIGWGGPASPRIRYIRFDPHEDPGGRTWRIDNVALTADDRAAPSYTFQFRDNALQAGTTAEIWLDGNRSGFDGTKVAGNLAVVAGTNAFTWGAKGFPNGTYWPYLVLRSSDGAVTRMYADAKLQVDNPSGPPFGSIDVAEGRPGSLRVAGWSIDPDTGVDEPNQVHVYVDGAFAGAQSAGAPRGDLAGAVPGWGSAHGFDLTLGAGGGTHTVCVYGINIGPGGNSLLGCRLVTVRAGSPFGSLDVVRAGAPGKIDLGGWIIDPDTPAPTDVHVYVNGVFSGAISANGTRGDVGAAFPGYGNQHGFSATVATQGSANLVCAYGINVGSGGNSLLGCGRVDFPVNPFGSLDVVRAGAPGKIDLGGWLLDPDTPAPVDVHVYVNGVFSGAITANGTRGDVGAFFPGYGAQHGFSTTVAARGADNIVCAYGINVGAGSNSLIGCGRAVVQVDPFGSVDMVRRNGDGSISVAGWAIDSDSFNSIPVHVYVGGTGYALTADASRPDVGAVFPGFGDRHGYQATLPGGAGPQLVCVYGLNSVFTYGGNALLGCAVV
jgi:hypothetical protein